MEQKLAELGIPPDTAGRILEAWEDYQRTAARHDKSGKLEYESALDDVERLSRKLAKKLAKLSNFEKQSINRKGVDVFEISCQLIKLNTSCKTALGRKNRFSKRPEPFLRDFAITLKTLLETAGIEVKIYRDNTFCRALNAFLEEPPESEKSFNILRVITKK
jgi:hypothetical protein